MFDRKLRCGKLDWKRRLLISLHLLTISDCHIQKRYEWSPWSECLESHQSRVRQCILDLGCKCQDIRQSQGCSPPPPLSIFEICQIVIGAFRNGEDTPKFEEICTGVNKDVDCRTNVIRFGKWILHAKLLVSVSRLKQSPTLILFPRQITVKKTILWNKFNHVQWLLHNVVKFNT